MTNDNGGSSGDGGVTGGGGSSGNVSADSLTVGSRVVVTSAATTGDTGVQFVRGGYAGPLAERRVDGTTRQGIGVYGDADTRVYSTSASSAGRVLLGFATSDVTHYDVLTVARDGSTIAGNVGVNTSSPTHPLHVVGDAYVEGAVTATGDVTAFSDARLKGNLAPLTSALDRCCALGGYTYERRDMPGVDRRFVGVIAQDVAAVLPEAVHSTGGTLAVSHAGVVALLVEAVKELRADLEAVRVATRRDRDHESAARTGTS